MLSLNPEHFSRTFSKIAGISYSSYRNMVRVEHAADMICNFNAKMTDIAFSCGFANVRSFNRIFKQYTGTPPSQFMELPNSVREAFPFYMKHEKREYVSGDSPVVMLISLDEIEK